MSDFYWWDDFFAHFVLPECWSLAQQKIGTLDQHLDQYWCVKYWMGVEYKELAIDAMYKCLPQCSYMQVVLATLHRRCEQIVNHQMEINLSPTATLPLPPYAVWPLDLQQDDCHCKYDKKKAGRTSVVASCKTNACCPLCYRRQQTNCY
jgi:hypothetical protein